MITLLASIAGFISSIFPEFIKYMKDVSDKKHELDILRLQIEYNQLAYNNRMEEIYVSRDIAESAALYSTYRTGVGWVDALNGTVRPLLAYSFFALYALLKYIQYITIGPIFTIEHLHLLWSIDDQAIFAGIISFYFGQRGFHKLWQKKT